MIYRCIALLTAIILSISSIAIDGFANPRPHCVATRKRSIWAAAPSGESREERRRRRELTEPSAPDEVSENPASELASLLQMLPCPCRSGKYFKSCCQPIVDSGELSSSPEALLRARFTAYAQEKVDFIILTTHETHPEFTPDIETWRRELVAFIRSVEFGTFKIISTEELEAGSKAAVTWSAQMRVLPDLLRPEVVQTKAFTERSILVFDSGLDGRGQWFYAGGDENFEPTNVLVRTGPKPKPRGGGGDDSKQKAKPKVRTKATVARK